MGENGLEDFIDSVTGREFTEVDVVAATDVGGGTFGFGKDQDLMLVVESFGGGVAFCFHESTD